ncbi:YaeQ family protein [Litoribrevibacter euphylliae]|uniref:YaeQ family protein n=1 Tax=Litoribrevibacter euphylliae TaxID=1834034 RepID=A0ABV7HL23_9GAMM
MALKATIFKAQVQISDLDRHYYNEHELTLARHPSETDQRMMTRLIAFALNAHPELTFTKGLSTREEPDLWQKSLQGDIDLWIELGQPDEKRLRKACSQSEHVIIYSLDNSTFNSWWQGVGPKVDHLANLTVCQLPTEPIETLSEALGRNLNLQATIQDQQLWLSLDDANVEIHPTIIKQVTT